MHLKTANNRNREITIQNFHVTEIYIFDTSAFSIHEYLEPYLDVDKLFLSIFNADIFIHMTEVSATCIVEGQHAPD